MGYFQDKVVFVTGGSRGMGFAIAKKFAENGAKTAICARDADSLQRAEYELRKISPQIIAFPADIADARSVKYGIEQINAAFGPIDILVNNAGIYRPGKIMDTSLSEWENQLAINLKGPFLVTQAVAPQMMERRSGRIIFISSMLAIVSLPGNACYTATKWGLEGFIGCIAQELCEYGIVVHTIRPGMTDTSIFDEIGKPDMEIDWIDPAEIANTVDFLCRLPAHAQVPEITYTNTFQRFNY